MRDKHIISESNKMAAHLADALGGAVITQLGIEFAVFAFRSAFQRMNEVCDDTVAWDRCQIFLEALKTEQMLRDLLNETPEQELTEQHIRLRNSLNRLAPNAAKLEQQVGALNEQANDTKKLLESLAFRN